MVKAIFARSLPVTERRSVARWRHRERGIWQRRFWEHSIRDDADFAAHVDYVHFNPVRHGYVAHAAEWPYSTFKACVRRGLYPEDWLGPVQNTLLPIPAASKHIPPVTLRFRTAPHKMTRATRTVRGDDQFG